MFTSDKSKLALKKFSTALGRLAEAVDASPSPLRSDAVLQRFEFTFELCWKALRIHLSENHGIEVASPKGTLKESFRLGLIEPGEEPSFAQMLEDRNLSSHAYDEQQALEIFNRVCHTHLGLLQNLRSRIEINT